MGTELQDQEKKQPARTTIGLLIKELRPKQWAKNLIVYAPLLFSGKVSSLPSLLAATLCFVAFCLVSSGIYVMNDVVDVNADRAHPTKKNRPIASGQLDIRLAAMIGILCFLTGLVIAFVVRPTLMVMCLVYVGLNVLYSLQLKNRPILDLLCIASGFVIRAVSGAVAVQVVPSSWFLLCTSFGALFLALEKRRTELKLLAKESTAHRKVLTFYSVSLLTRMESIIVPCLLTSYAFYTFQSSIHSQWMMMTVPIVMYGVMRYQLLSEQGTSTGAPEEVLFKDKQIQLTLLFWVITCTLIIYGDLDRWLYTVANFIDSFSVH